MYIELGDMSSIRCPANDLVCEVDFKTKGFFAGEINAISGKIKKDSTGDILATLSGKWTDTMYIQYNNNSTSTIFGGSKEKSVLFDVSASQIYPKHVVPEESQEEFESRR
jgi:hypothetical protein